MAGIAPMDAVLLGILLLSALVGVLRGLFREAISLASWVAAAWIAARYPASVAPAMADVVANEQLRLWAARALLFVAVLILGGLAGVLASMLLRTTRLGGLDRLLGTLFGIARGVLLVGVIVAVGVAAGMADEPWWQQSKLIPYAAPVADALREAAEQGLGRSRSLQSLP